MTIQHTKVLPGEGWYTLGTRLCPKGTTTAQRNAFVTKLTAANGANLKTPIYAGQVLHYDDADLPVATPPPPPAATRYGVDPALAVGSGSNLTTVVVNGGAYRLPPTVADKEFVLTNGAYLYAADGPTTMTNCSVTSNAPISNTSAMVQARAQLTVDLCSFDGGIYHCRGIQADYGVSVTRSKFTRFGNAAVEMNDRSASCDLSVSDCHIFEPPGWTRGDHTDGIQVGAGRNVTITRCTVIIHPYRATIGDETDVSNSALGLWAELGNISGDVSIVQCRLAGGGFTVYLQPKPPYTWLHPVRVSETMFDRHPAETGGYGSVWGPLYSPHAALNQTANVWEDLTPVVL